MYIDNYEIVTLGDKYEGNKTKKNQLMIDYIFVTI